MHCAVLVLSLLCHDCKCELPATVIRTFGKLSNPADLYDKCQSLSESLANDLHDERLVVRNPAAVFHSMCTELFAYYI